MIEGVVAPKKLRSLKTTRAGYSFNDVAFERACRLEGLKGYVTNLPVTLASAQEIIGWYHELWKVEQSFRMSKTDLRARPIFHSHKEVIEAHLTVVMAALAVSRYLYEKTGITAKRLVKTLYPFRRTIGKVGNAKVRLTTPLPGEIKKILKKLDQNTKN